jgi:hypothetical protein
MPEVRLSMDDEVETGKSDLPIVQFSGEESNGEGPRLIQLKSNS